MGLDGGIQGRLCLPAQEPASVPTGMPKQGKQVAVAVEFAGNKW